METKTELLMSLAEKRSLEEWLTQYVPDLIVDGNLDDRARAAIKLAQGSARSQGLYGGSIDGLIGPLSRAAFSSMGWNPPERLQDHFSTVSVPMPTAGKLKPLTQAEKTKLFGTPLKSDGTLVTEFKKRIKRIYIPQLVGVYGAPKDGVIDWHEDRADKVIRLFQAIEDAGYRKHLLSYAGSWNPRFVRGSNTTFSSHAWGIAFDINAPQNWLGQKPAGYNQVGCLWDIVNVAVKEGGWYWGGWFTRLDGMHFECCA